MVAYSYIEVDVCDALVTVRLNRPEVRNAINRAMHLELQHAFDRYAADPRARVCVVTGAGDGAFCAGSDLKEGSARMARGDTDFSYPPSGYAGLIARYDLDKPLIAVVNGAAMGGGFEIALACDVVIASENARFGLPEPLVGQVALGGGLHRLARQIGLKQAMGMILTGRTVTAQEGRELGFVNEVAPPADLWQAADRWIEQMMRASPAALRASKQCVMRGLDAASLAQALTDQALYPAFVAWRSSSDNEEGARAFAEKRQPNWAEPGV